MNRLFFILSILVATTYNVSALSLKEGFQKIADLPNIEGVKSGGWTDYNGGWLSSIPMESATVTYKIHEIGNGQTVYYGSDIEATAKQLPKESMILQGADYSNLIYFFAQQIDTDNSELLILIDQAYQGKTTAVLGKVNNQIIKAIKNGEIKFTHDHRIIVSVPILTCD